MKNYVKKGQKLPLYGIGPMIVFAMGAVTAIGIILFSYVWKIGVLETPWVLLCRIAGVLLIVSGLAVWFIGACALVTIPVNWALLTVTLKLTEEKWLLDLYGQDYADYMKQVNRCIPWPPHNI